ncbi:fimbrillin family protein [Segatella copri]|uniref:fimbrillin family protein n=1 Tax=Segatella copri TaxID=165179 RepID=UPI003F6F0DC7
MYKKFFMGIAAMAALTLVSCSSDDLNSLSDNSSKNEAISFDGYLGRSAVAVNGSRGSVETKNQLKTDGFGVFGNYSTGGQNFGSNLFNNVKVYSSSTADPVKWEYDNTKYWPTEGHIDFLAYAPYADKTALNTTLDGKMTSCINFTVENTVTKQKDLLWANAKDQTKANNSGAKKVEFTFNHALAKIGYKVKLKDDYKNVTIKLKKITLAGSTTEPTKKAFYTKGTIDLSKTSSDAELWTKPTSAEKQNFDWFSGDKSVTSTSESNPDTDYLFVIPQDFSNTDELYVIVEYTIQNGSTETMTSTVSSKLTKNFLQGKAYTINLTIGLTPIEFNADVTGWVDDNTIPEIPLN